MSYLWASRTIELAEVRRRMAKQRSGGDMLKDEIEDLNVRIRAYNLRSPPGNNFNMALSGLWLIPSYKRLDV